MLRTLVLVLSVSAALPASRARGEPGSSPEVAAADERHLELELERHLRQAAASERSTRTSLGAALFASGTVLVTASAWLLSRDSDDRPFRRAQAIAFGGAGLMQLAVGTSRLLRPSLGETVDTTLGPLLRTSQPGALEYAERRLASARRIARSLRQQRRTSSYLCMLLGVAGFVIVESDDIFEEERGAARLSMLGVVGLGAWMYAATRSETPTETAARLWLERRGQPTAPRPRANLSLVPVEGGATLGLHGSF